MKRLASKLSIGTAALLISAGLAFAQAPQAPAPATPKAPPAAAPKAPAATTSKGVPKKASTPEGIECSKQADEKKLHGKERKSFRAKCIRDLKKAAAPAKKN
ncbi:MAG: PsiF family protein [Hyphomicrobiaceae bacterium]